MPDSGGYAIGIDIGVTNVKYVCVTAGGGILEQDSTTTGADMADWPSNIRGLIRSIERQRGPAIVLGLAAPGLASRDGSRIAWMQGRLDQIQGLNWIEFLGRKSPTPILNDAHAALLGEVWLGAARGMHNVLMLTLGTGVGGALMVDGRLLRGHLGRAGHLGHISLNPAGLPDIVNTPGSLEEAIGNCTIKQRSLGRFETTHDLIAAYDAGDQHAAEVWLASIRALAAGLASLINVTDPQIAIIGGGIARAGRSLFEPLARALDQFEWRPNGNRVCIEPAQLGEYAGALGAARNALPQDSNA